MKLVNPIAMQNDRILVKPDMVQEVSKGGIIIPNADRQREQRATVVAVGPGAWNGNGERNKPLVEPGHRIVYGKYVGAEVLLEMQDENGTKSKGLFIAIREDDVIAVIGE